MRTKASFFFDQQSKWKDEFDLLRKIIRTNSLLEEDFKWKHPCYTLHGKNVVIIHGFKHYCALLFFKGALLKDSRRLLVQQTENVQSGRQIRFSNLAEIKKLENNILSYINEAIEIERSGEKIVKKETSDYPIPEEFQLLLKDDSNLAKAFKSLTPGRQRAYLFFFNQAKQTKTKQARIMKYYHHILAKKGLDDK